MSLILDSGAFGVFNKGEIIELDDYINFCINHPKCSYFVNLDKMPKSSNSSKILTEQDLNESAETSWKNLERMSQYIPKEKLITVFHQGEHFEYLHKMFSNYSYIGLSFATYRRSSKTNRIQWLNKCKKILSQRKFPKVHGFGITAFPILKAFPWHSVDSASWIYEANCGNIFVPATAAKNKFDYTQAPHLLAVSDTNPITSGQNLTWSDMSPAFAHHVKQWLDLNKMAIGSWTQKTIEDGYKLIRGKERWHNPYPKLKNKGKGFGFLDIPELKKRVIIIQKKGIRTDDQFRKKLNIKFYIKINEHLPIKYIYLAGLIGKDSKKICPTIPNRLLSFAQVRNRKEAQDSLAWHMEHTE